MNVNQLQCQIAAVIGAALGLTLNRPLLAQEVTDQAVLSKQQSSTDPALRSVILSKTNSVESIQAEPFSPESGADSLAMTDQPLLLPEAVDPTVLSTAQASDSQISTDLISQSVIPPIITPIESAQGDPFSPEGTADDLATDDQLSVDQLSDVAPDAWAFQALQSLIERYGCIAGYPDGSFRGDRTLSRYEFAAFLNRCLESVTETWASREDESGQAEDLETVQALQLAFREELQRLESRIEQQNQTLDTLESQQFSATTKLSGEAIFAITGVITGDNQTVSDFPTRPIPANLPFQLPDPLRGPIEIEDNNLVFANRLRLNFNTSFTGKDLLNIRLVSGNFPHPGRPDGGFRYGPDPFGAFLSIGGDFGGRTLEGQQTFNDIGSAPADNTVALNKLDYAFPVGKRLQVAVMGVGAEHHDYIPSTFSFWDDDNGGNGSLSVLGQRNPIYGIGVGGGVGSGVGLSYTFNKQIELSAGYIGTSAADSSEATQLNPFGGGLFNGRNVTLAQLTVQPTDNLSLGLIYSHSRHPFGLPIFANDLGTTLANNPIYPQTQTLNVNAYGLSGLWQVTPKLGLNAWFSYLDVQGSAGTSITGQSFDNSGRADVLTYGVGIALPDLGKEGNLGGLVFGAAPYVTRSRIPSPLEQPPSFPSGLDALGTDNLLSLIPRRSIPWHFEVFYRHQINDNMSITPGLIWLLAPNQTNVNPDVLIGTARLTFSF